MGSGRTDERGPNQGGALGDAEIRRALKTQLRRQFAGERGTVLLDELGLCLSQARVDLVVVNGRLHGFEIKSDRDSLRRLARQAEYYGQVFDRLTLVVGSRHIRGAMRMVPPWWEIISVDASSARLALSVARGGSDNPGRSASALAQLIWRDRAIRLLEKRKAARGYYSKPRSAIWDRLCQLYTVDELAGAVRALLKARPRLESARRSG